MAYIPCKIGGGRQPIEMPQVILAPTQTTLGTDATNTLKFNLNGKYKKLSFDSVTCARCHWGNLEIKNLDNDTSLLNSNAPIGSTEINVSGIQTIGIYATAQVQTYSYERPNITITNLIIN